MNIKWQRFISDPNEMNILCDMAANYGLTRTLLTVFGKDVYEGIKSAYANGTLERLFPEEIASIGDNFRNVAYAAKDVLNNVKSSYNNAVQNHPKSLGIIDRRIIQPSIQKSMSAAKTVRGAIHDTLYGNNGSYIGPNLYVQNPSGSLSNGTYLGTTSRPVISENVYNELSSLNPFNKNNIIDTLSYTSPSKIPPGAIANMVHPGGTMTAPEISVLMYMAGRFGMAYAKRAMSLYKSGILAKTDPKVAKWISKALAMKNNLMV